MITRRYFLFACCFSRRSQRILLVAIVATLSIVLLTTGGLSSMTMIALAPPPPLHHDLHHLRRSRKLQSYIDDIAEPLIEPSTPPCQDMDDLSFVALVSSAPHRFEERNAIRATWGKEVPTVFFLGLPNTKIDEQLVDNYMEAKQHRDIVVGDFVDSYQNLTLKTAVMLRWGARRCAHAAYALKTDDDVLVNPWGVERVLRDHDGADMIGYMKNNSFPHRDAYNKWYLPRWLYPQEVIPEYLSGTAYLIKGSRLSAVYRAAFDVPLINLEDVYFTYLVARRALALRPAHDARLSPYRAGAAGALGCAHWPLATQHSLAPARMRRAWPGLRALADRHLRGDDVCAFYTKYLHSEYLLY